jgi:hypothetical protein
MDCDPREINGSNGERKTGMRAARISRKYFFIIELYLKIKIHQRCCKSVASFKNKRIGGFKVQVQQCIIKTGHEMAQENHGKDGKQRTFSTFPRHDYGYLYGLIQESCCTWNLSAAFPQHPKERLNCRVLGVGEGRRLCRYQFATIFAAVG